jgi:hypothetical protein
MDPSLPEKLNVSKLFDAGNGADRTTDPQGISRAPHADPSRDVCSVNAANYDSPIWFSRRVLVACSVMYYRSHLF